MASLGDYVSNLILDSSRYTAGAQQGIVANKALSGSIDSIMGQLERQKKQLDSFGATTRTNILGTAAKGATEGEINAALSLSEENDARRAAIIEQENLNAAKLRGKEVGDALIKSLLTEIATYGMSANQIQLRTAAQNGASAADIRRATALQHQRDAQSAATASMNAMISATVKEQNAVDTIVKSLQRQADMLGMNAGQMRLYEARQAGATEADLKRIVALNRVIGSTSGVGRGNLIAIETIRGLEDAASGFSTNGLKGMLIGVTNNITQIGALAGGAMGLYVSIGATAALIGATLIPMLYKWATNTEAVEKATKKLEEEQTKNHERAMRRAEELNRRQFNRQDRDRENADILGNRLSNQGVTAGMRGFITPLGTELRDEEERNRIEARKAAREKQTFAEQQMLVKQRRDALIDERNLAQIMDRETVAQLEARMDVINKLFDEERDLIIKKKQARQDERAAEERLAATELKRIKIENDEKIREANRVKGVMAQNEREAREQIEEEQRKLRETGKKFVAQSLAQSIAQLDPGLAAAKELEDRRKKIEQFRSRGLISDQEASLLQTTVFAKPDPVAGGVAANVAGSREAYSSIMRAMRSAEQAKEQEKMRALAQQQLNVLEKIEEELANDEIVEITL